MGGSGSCSRRRQADEVDNALSASIGLLALSITLVVSLRIRFWLRDSILLTQRSDD